MKRLKPWLVILLVFAAGFAGGVVATRARIRHFIQESISRPDGVRELMEERMVRRLQLDDGQRGKVHRILVDHQAQMRGLRREFAPRLFQITSEAESEISEILTPQQRERFDRLREQNRRLLAPLRE